MRVFFRGAAIGVADTLAPNRYAYGIRGFYFSHDCASLTPMRQSHLVLNPQGGAHAVVAVHVRANIVGDLAAVVDVCGAV